jgi:23S rRNA pseudouridine2605 synthase
MERLHKFMARCGVASRRKAEEMIAQGRVEVNGELVRELGTKVGPDDHVTLDGALLRAPALQYVLLNKPRGVITTMDDPQKRTAVTRFLPALGVTLKPVGRLDMDSEGLLICTNDGELAARLTHPRYAVEKEYVATVRGLVEQPALERLRKGVYLSDGKTAPARVDVMALDRKAGSTKLRVVIHEGRNRQIRRMVGHPVISLKRVRLGPVVMKGMRAGEARLLSQVEVRALYEAVRLARS